MDHLYGRPVTFVPEECKLLQTNIPKNVRFVFNDEDYWLVYTL